MPSVFGISISGLQTSQAALNTTAQNISNANVEGYSRQRVSQETRNPEFIGGNYFGSGVEVGRVVRIFDKTQQLEIQAATASFNQLESYLAEAGRVDGLLADSDNGLNQAMQSFFSSLQGVVNDPASVSARQVMLSQTNGLVSRFASIHGQLETQSNQINTNIESIAEEVSALGQSIASLNNQISGSSGTPPPDFLDKRDAAITRLSKLVAVQTIEQSDGSFNVFIGSGQSLVVGSISNSLVAAVDDQNPRRRVLNLTAGSSAVNITSNLNGGKL
ncbi:MAG: flagellar hook-associated protein FlgK, partial [Enterobacterales bacterium]|nr:flagellar hook-associated protein FlgK [Enterobacterales bacterium]